MPLVDSNEIRRTATRRLVAEGVIERHAHIVVDHLVTADLWGRSSHGMSVRFEGILARAKKGVGRADPVVAIDRGTVLTVDGRDGFGQVGGRVCADLLTERLAKRPLVAVALRNARHTGMLGYYVDRCARAGFVAIACTHCRPLMAPFGGKHALLGTNPIAFGLPAQPHPIVVDLGTAAVSFGHVMQCAAQGSDLPPGVALDRDGRETTDAAAARDGCLLPFGGHRGGALALAIQCLAGVLTGAGVFPDADQNYGLLLVGMHRGAFTSGDEYDKAMERFVDGYLAAEPREGCEVRIPGWGHRQHDPTGEQTVEVTPELAISLGLA